MGFSNISDMEIDELYNKLKKEAKDGGYNLNPDLSVTKELIKGLLINEKRYGYWACPCRLAIGIKSEDLDIICPCDYRDDDINDYNACFCALYVSKNVVEGKVKVKPIPERRLSKEEKKQSNQKIGGNNPLNQIKYPIWRCKVCGYLCARDHPPEVCPICKAKKERFENLI
jgi:ferredoxin-thioredoxin reductase catalytic subunit